jgi:hypothetical protein
VSTISTSTSAWRARSGLLDAIRAALADEPKVDIDAGLMGAARNLDWIALEGISVDANPKDIGPRRSYDETITLSFTLGSYRAGRGDEIVTAAFERADALLALVNTYVTTGDNTTLGGVVAWCFPGSAEWAAEEVEGGFQVEVEGTFVATHRVRAA